MTALAPDQALDRATVLAQLPERLRQRRTELTTALSARLHKDTLGDEHDEAGLPRRADETDDDAAAETARERDLADLARLTAELRQVDAALARATQGELGDCSDCGEPIEAARLHVNPAAVRCSECQQMNEHRRAHARLLGG